MTEVTLDELKKEFNVDISWAKTIAWVKTFKMRGFSDGVTYSGRLYWDSNDGYTVHWDNDVAPAMADRPEFEYTLDSYATDPWFVPPFGDLSDAGMDGA